MIDRLGEIAPARYPSLVLDNELIGQFLDRVVLGLCALYRHSSGLGEERNVTLIDSLLLPAL